MSECPNVRMSECPNVRMSECPNVRMSECLNVRMDEWMKGIHGGVAAWRRGGVAAWRRGCMDSWKQDMLDSWILGVQIEWKDRLMEDGETEFMYDAGAPVPRPPLPLVRGEPHDQERDAHGPLRVAQRRGGEPVAEHGARCADHRPGRSHHLRTHVPTARAIRGVAPEVAAVFSS
eukprot:gene12621-biopygen12035